MRSETETYKKLYALFVYELLKSSSNGHVDRKQTRDFRARSKRKKTTVIDVCIG